MHVGFKRKDADDESTTATKTVKEHTGADMGKFWKELEEEVTVKWPEERHLVNASDEDEDEEMGDDDDNDFTNEDDDDDDDE
jgi:hypothetical protein